MDLNRRTDSDKCYNSYLQLNIDLGRAVFHFAQRKNMGRETNRKWLLRLFVLSNRIVFGFWTVAMNHDEDWSNECALSCINDIKNFGHLLVRRWRDLNFICPATVFTIEHRFCYINVIYLKTRVFIDICFNKARNTLAPDFVTNCFFSTGASNFEFNRKIGALAAIDRSFDD